MRQPSGVCGLWLSAQRLCAVISEDSGHARTGLSRPAAQLVLIPPCGLTSGLSTSRP